jgi:hypothetical protein
LFDQPLKATQESALLVDQLMVEDPLTSILEGEADRIRLGLGIGGDPSTVIVIDSEMGPPSLPKQEIVYAVVSSGPTEACPVGVVSLVQLPSALQLTELIACQVITEVPPSVMDNGFALMIILAGPLSLLLLLLPLPPPQAETVNKIASRDEYLKSAYRFFLDVI